MRRGWIAAVVVMSAVLCASCRTPGVHELLPYMPTDYEEIERRLEAGANPNARDYEGRSLLWRAVLRSDVRLVRVLLEHGADPSLRLRAKGGETALHLAARRGDDEVVEILLEARVDVNTATRGGITPLHRAAEMMRASTVELLLSRGADPISKSRNGETPLNVIGVHGEGYGDWEDYLSVVKLLLDEGVPVDVEGFRKRTPLFDACRSHRADVVEYLLAKGASPNHRDNYGRTPLMIAASRSSPEIISLLLEAGADIGARDNEGRSAVDFARERADLEILQLLEG